MPRLTFELHTGDPAVSIPLLPPVPGEANCKDESVRGVVKGEFAIEPVNRDLEFESEILGFDDQFF